TRYGQEYDPENEIIVTTGASEAVDLAFRAFVDAGDVGAIPQPSYISYTPGAIFAGGEPLPVPTHAEDEFKLTPKALEAAGADEADVLVRGYPNNPASAVMTDAELADVADFVREHDLLVLSDEIYADLRYEDDQASIATHPG
ncbi:aromatic amino acid aminotransferase, partial [Haloferax sp. Atlit-47N]|uniref:pyridoxal phosphate-dependent aminotransferase n=1 Tax=Haloferax sp. Atlit-47N TaxID=2077199 RepID=UPI000E26766D